jgi:hypothetical protein
MTRRKIVLMWTDDAGNQWVKYADYLVQINALAACVEGLLPGAGVTRYWESVKTARGLLAKLEKETP